MSFILPAKRATNPTTSATIKVSRSHGRVPSSISSFEPASESVQKRSVAVGPNVRLEGTARLNSRQSSIAP